MIPRISCFLFFIAISVCCFSQSSARDFYELRIYTYNDTAQESVLDAYLENALIPALSRKKVKPVGVFKAVANDTAKIKTLYVLVPFRSYAQSVEIGKALNADAAYRSAGSAYLDAGFKTPPYTRMESVFLDAFSMAPLVKPSKLKSPLTDRVYELRSYESATEKIAANKVQMFNKGGEVALFNRLGFDAAFYGEVVSGARKPNLMYLTRFDNQAARDAHWKAFGEDPEWKKLSARPEYQDNVSHIDIIFLRPATYSAL